MNKIEHIYSKTICTEDYINEHDLGHLFTDINHKCSRYNISDYLKIYFIFENSGTSYRNFYMIAQYFYSLGVKGNDYPKMTSLNKFKQIMSSNNILNQIHTDYVNDEKVNNNKNLSIDTSFIPNSNCQEGVGRSAYFKNRNGIKLNNVCDHNGFCLKITIDPGNNNDSLLGKNIISDNSHLFINNTLLADSGYDSNEIRSLCNTLNCKYIIPKNKRNKDNCVISKIKREEKNKINTERCELMKKQKKERIKHKKYIKRQKDKIKKARYVEDINYLNKLINANKEKINNCIDQIKTKRKSLNTELKNKITIRIRQFKELNKKGCKCEYDYIKCPLCNTLGICDVCYFCKKCNKDMKYYKDMSKEEIKLYRNRIKVENNFSHLKYGRVTKVNDKKLMMYENSVYCRLLDLIIFDMNKK